MEKNTNPLVSIIVPVYNVEKYIHKCINSIISQTYSNIEVLLIDDGSVDASCELCMEFSQKDDRIRFFSQNNSGVSVARNKGLLESHGDLLMFVDPDDWIEPQMIEKQIQKMNSVDADISCCTYKKIVDGRSITRSVEEKVLLGIDIFVTMLCEDYYMTSVWNKMFKREVVFGGGEPILFEQGLSVGEDEKWLCSIILKNEKIKAIMYNMPFYNWRIRTGSAVHTATKSITKQNVDNLDTKKYVYELAVRLENKDLEKIAAEKMYAVAYYLMKKYMRMRDSSSVKSMKNYMRPGRGAWYKHHGHIDRFKHTLWELYSWLYIMVVS